MKNYKKYLRWLAVIGFNLLVVVIFAELCGLAIFFFQHGELFYAHKPKHELIAETERGELVKGRLHPLFGYLLRTPGTASRFGLTINNYGFFSNHGDYPLQRNNEEQYIIGVFGGSVANQFHLQGRQKLIENLKKHAVFKDKEIIVLSFSNGAYKQPQQLLIFTYFLAIGQPMDMVINIDGYNEVVVAANNYNLGIEPAMPSGHQLSQLQDIIDQSTLTPDKLDTLTNINRYKNQLNYLAEKINSNSLASMNFVLDQLYKILFNRYQHSLVYYDRLETPNANNSLIYINRISAEFDPATLYDKLSNLWVESSILMQQTAAARNILYFHVLQPNQYYGKKIFSEEEKEIAINPKLKRAKMVQAGYPALISKFDLLSQNGVTFFNGVSIFDHEQDIVYIDDCCHYTKLGYEIMADFITDFIFASSQALEM